MTLRLRGAAVGAIAVAATALASACNLPTSIHPPSGGALGVDSIAADTQYTGTLETDQGGDFAFAGASEVAVGDLDASTPGETMRGLVTFDISRYTSSTVIKSATIRVDECAVFGNPFTPFGSVVIDHVVPLTPPTLAVYNDSTLAANVGVIAPDNTIGFRYLTVTGALSADVFAGRTLSAYRLRFSVGGGNNNGVSDYVDFRSAESGDCSSDSTRLSLLIVTT